MFLIMTSTKLPTISLFLKSDEPTASLTIRLLYCDDSVIVSTQSNSVSDKIKLDNSSSCPVEFESGDVNNDINAPLSLIHIS